MPRTGRAAARAAREWIGRSAYSGLCKAFVREEVFEVRPSQSQTAIEAWREARHKHLTSNPEKVPAFVPAFMDTRVPAEHVLFTVGRDRQGHRLAISADAWSGNRIGLVRLSEIVDAWGPLLGWSEDLDGQRVWNPRPSIRLDHIIHAAIHDDDVKGDKPLHPRAVGVVEKALVAERLLAPRFTNGRFGPRDRRAYAGWQKRAGFPVTGIPTLADLSKLGMRRGFDVR